MTMTMKRGERWGALRLQAVVLAVLVALASCALTMPMKVIHPGAKRPSGRLIKAHDDFCVEMGKELAVMEEENRHPVKCMLHTSRSTDGEAPGPIHVNIPVTLASLSVNASVSVRDFVGQSIFLQAKAMPRFYRDLPDLVRTTEVPLKGDTFHNVTGERLFELIAETNEGALAPHPEDEDTGFVRVGWTSEPHYFHSPQSKELLALTRSHRRFNHLEQMAQLEMMAQEWEEDHAAIGVNQTLQDFLRERPGYHAGNGGSLGTWTFLVGGPGALPGATSDEVHQVKEWSLEMCFDARTNYRTMCQHQPTYTLVWGEEEEEDSEAKVEAMAGRRGWGRAASASSASPGFCLPGFRWFCNARLGRIADDQKCAAAGYAFNPFVRLSRRYCCAKSRWLFWRHFMRKNFTPVCRRFFR